MGPKRSRLEELEREADRKMKILADLYLRVPKRKRRKAYRIFLDIAEGKITYEEGLKKLRELAKP